MKLNVLEGQTTDQGTQVVTSVIKVKDLVENYDVDVFDHEKGRAGKGGYQRKANQARIKKLAKLLSEIKVTIPTAILGNIRNPIEKVIKFDNFGASVINFTSPVMIIDGQHRVASFAEVYNNHEFYGVDQNKFGEIKLFISLLWNASLQEEINQFYVVNSNAKSIPTGNKLELEAYIGSGDDLISELVDLTWALDKSDTWKGKIKFPNSSNGLIPNSGVVSSLKNVFNDSNLKKLSFDQKLNLLNAVWGGVRMVLPGCFKNPEKYTLQKGIGVNTIHGLIPDIYSDILASNGITFDKKSILDPFEAKVWKKYLEPLATYSDTDQSGEDNEVVGEDFWRIGKTGAAGQYSSGQGRSVLLRAFQREILGN
jgi:DGQHR domain-containing protein